MHSFRTAFVDELVKLGALGPVSKLTPESSNVRGYRYDPGEQSLFVTFKSGGTYRYDGVTPGIAKSLGRNKSVGKTINRLVKGKGLSYEKVGSARDRLMEAVAEALRVRNLRGPLARDVGVQAIKVRRGPPPIPRSIARAKGNVLAPVSGEIDALKKSAGLRTRLMRALHADPTVGRRRRAMGVVAEELGKSANGDMLQYFQDNPDKLREKIERDRKKESRNSTRNHWAKQASSTLEFMREVKESPVIEMIAENLLQRGLAALIHDKGTTHKPRRARSRGHHKHAASIEAFYDDTWRSLHKLAGVAKKQVTFDRLRMKLEYEPGDIRSGKAKDGKTWERKMFASYGYVPGTKGMAADGDAIDIYLAPNPKEGCPVFEVRQVKKDGAYDESKFMIGWPTAESAKAAYLHHMPDWAFGSMKMYTENVPDFAAGIHMAPKVASPLAPRVVGQAAHQAQLTAPPSLAVKLQGIRNGAPMTPPPPPPVAAKPAPGAPKPPKAGGKLPGIGKTGSVLTRGFADELVKEAGLLDVIKNIARGRAAPKKLGFFERRRVAKALGVKPRDVESTISHRQRVRGLKRGASVLGAAGIGALAGNAISKENVDG